MLGDSQFAKQGFGKHSPWIDLVNSLEHDGFGHTEDHLANPRWLESFLQRWNFTVPSEAAPEASFRRLRGLLLRSAEQLAASRTLTPNELRDLNAAISVAARRKVFQRQNGFELREIPEREGWDWIQAQIAAAFARMIVEGPIERIKFCQDDKCRWIFMDKTKGKTRRWCNERTCGNRNRVRRARALNKVL